MAASSVHHSKESNAHYYAKLTFRNWCEKTFEYNRIHGYKNVLSHLEWNGACPLLEYPIYSKRLADGSKDILGLKIAWDHYPSEDQIKDGQLRTEAVIDLVLCDNGRPKYGIEIVHKHPCSAAKRTFLAGLRTAGYDFTVYEVSAEWILDQLHGHVPKILNMVKL